MTEFEREIVNAFNRFFEKEEIDAYAHRKKQHRFTSQVCDVLVDSPHEMFYLAIENKSVKTESTGKLYFSQHFSETEEIHQVERIQEFIDRSGRKGLLAVELKNGRGRKREGYMVPWEKISSFYREGKKGISLEDIRDHPPIERNSENYDIEKLCKNLDI